MRQFVNKNPQGWVLKRIDKRISLLKGEAMTVDDKSKRATLREARIRDLTINEFLRYARKCIEKEK